MPLDRHRLASRVPVVVSVVVTFRGLADTTRCVESLLASDYPAQHVVVVDNGSGNADADILESRFGERIVLIRSRQNLGYGGGANLGIQWAIRQAADYVWVLNNDTVIPRDALGSLVRCMEANPRLGAVSPEIVAPIGPEAPTGVWYAGGILSLERAATHHEHRSLDGTRDAVATGYISGCAMFLRCVAVKGVGAFWERLFLYWEDVDLSLRLLRAGWGLAVIPSAVITHFIHGSVRSEVAERYYFRNALLVARRHGSSGVAALAAWALAYRLARLWGSAFLRRRPIPQAETRGLLAGAVLALRWTLRRPTEFDFVPDQPLAAASTFEAADTRNEAG